ncbi:TPA: tRNA (adenosine(37)-N6)-threonylcarbamoyltransferase complex transferase subunit TsaD [Candidatus Uhrbacteria bacterium]|nr:tRNA (adenosine(37)-N6)-threonylcarbamoyltransferase complex transferase subunit TsaD [Candidatus Uhrbacteria bacterium]
MKILAIETSCDETAVALVEGDGSSFTVLENLVSSQISTHQQYGGVVPEVAARMHVPVLPPMIAALTGWKKGDIDAVAVTTGPGLSTALRVGVETAKALAVSWGIPLVPVDHIEGHIYANFLDRTVRADAFPILCLIVSGGHTELVLMKDHGEYTFLGQTRDDAAGEAFDKTAAQLGLSYPGGPSVSLAASKGNAEAYILPRPMLWTEDYDFSFSGLKTAVRNLIAGFDSPSDQMIADVCASFQAAVVEVLVKKTHNAAMECMPKTVMLCGGVSANRALRGALQAVFAKTDIAVLVPELTYTTDNAAMIGAAGLRGLVDGKAAQDPLVIDADSAKTLGGHWKWE